MKARRTWVETRLRKIRKEPRTSTRKRQEKIRETWENKKGEKQRQDKGVARKRAEDWYMECTTNQPDGKSFRLHHPKEHIKKLEFGVGNKNWCAFRGPAWVPSPEERSLPGLFEKGWSVNEHRCLQHLEQAREKKVDHWQIGLGENKQCQLHINLLPGTRVRRLRADPPGDTKHLRNNNLQPRKETKGLSLVEISTRKLVQRMGTKACLPPINWVKNS